MLIFGTNLKRLIIYGQLLLLLIAFGSIYTQIHGLFGERGLVPVAPQLECDEDSIFECRLPLLRLTCTIFHLSPSVGLQFLALMGMIISAIAINFHKCQNIITFFTLYFMYRTIYEAGGVFMYYQWDALLLESTICVGLLAWFEDGPGDMVAFFTLTNLLVRITFMNSVTKLLSKCPEWWNLTALNYHYESQPLPNAFAWYFHHLPSFFKEYITLFSYYAEIFLPPLFLTPLIEFRLVCFFCQILLATMNVFTGNTGTLAYNIVILSLSLLMVPRNDIYTKALSSLLLLKAVYSVFQFPWAFDRVGPKLSLTITLDEFQNLLTRYIDFSILYMTAMFAITFGFALHYTLTYNRRLRKNIHLAVVTLISVIFLCYGTIPMLRLDEKLSHRTTESPHIMQYFKLANSWGLMNSYGSFRQMTGQHGRPEIVIEGSHQIEGPWKEFEFIGKPGSLSKRPIFLAPHQPRLDYQMYHAAEGTYQQNPFFLSLAYHLMQNTTEVVSLLEDYPFKNRSEPMKFVRAKLYMYHFTKIGSKDWWTRDFQEEYMPAFNKGNEALTTYLKEHKILRKDKATFTNGPLGKSLKNAHRMYSGTDHLICIATLLSSIIIMKIHKQYTDRAHNHAHAHAHDD